MPMAVPYLRFSSAIQHYGDSHRRQQESVGRWLQLNPSYELSSIKYEDLGVSGWTGKHREKGALGELLEAVESGAIPAGSVVLVEAIDRLSRLPAMEALGLINLIVTHGVDLVTLEDGQLYDKSSTADQRLFMLVAKVQAANEYSNRLSDRIAASYKGRAEKAKTGQRVRRRNGFWLTTEGHLKPDEAAIVQDVFSRFITGEGIRAIARRYSDQFANPSSVRKLLTNVATVGHWQRYDSRRNPTELIKNAFDPAIEEATFYQAQQMLKKSPGLVHPRKNPIAGLVICAECGGNLAKRNANARSPTQTMGCYARMLNKDSCSNSKTYPVPVLAHVFWETMRGHYYRAMQKARLTDVEKERLTLQARVDRVQTQKRQLLDMLSRLGDDNIITEQFAALKADEDSLQAQIAALPADSSEVQIGIREFYAALNNDPFAVTKTLQIGGYRITCDSQGRMDVDGDAFTYLGYVRKRKTWLIQTPDGDVVTPDER